MPRILAPDPERRVDIPGVPAPVRRPVDVDEKQTGFKALRTLRIYAFDAASVVEGHAEEDEVFILVLSGQVTLSIQADGWNLSRRPFTLGAATTLAATVASAGAIACGAYLPPHGEYRLEALTAAEVAYARATPVGIRAPAILERARGPRDLGAATVLDESTRAERLRLKLFVVDAGEQDRTLTLPIDRAAEAMVHVRTAKSGDMVQTESHGAGGEVTRQALRSMDTLACAPGERTLLHFARGTRASALLVAAA